MILGWFLAIGFVLLGRPLKLNGVMWGRDDMPVSLYHGSGPGSNAV